MGQISYKNFNNKAKIYANTRSCYSNNYINIFCNQLCKQENTYVADIAAGTGINTKQISKFCNKIFAIEPNDYMLQECKNHCKNISNIEYMKATSDNTMLPDKSIDIITIAQAFQLLDLKKTKIECKRILKENGKVILVWNSKESKNDFFYATEQVLLKFCPLYKRDFHVINFNEDTFSDFFRNTPKFYKFMDDGEHFLTKKEFIGRALCASYSLTSKDNMYDYFISALEEVFDKFSVNGLVYAPLSTIIYVGMV